MEIGNESALPALPSSAALPSSKTAMLALRLFPVFDGFAHGRGASKDHFIRGQAGTGSKSLEVGVAYKSFSSSMKCRP